MLNTYHIYFRYRGLDRKAYVQVMDETFCLVNLSDGDILTDFSGQLTFDLPKKTCTLPVKNKDAKDGMDLVRAISAQLR